MEYGRSHTEPTIAAREELSPTQQYGANLILHWLKKGDQPATPATIIHV